MVEISIICPVYNVENYIHKCIDSILLQTFKNWELLLINDGSTDNSGKICDEYSIRDSRIKVYHKKNSGVSSTRQLGIDISSGQYLIHIDPDDWVDERMLEDMYEKILEKQADLLICDFFVNNSNGEERYIKQDVTSCKPDKVLRGLFYGIHGSCCNKLVKKNVIINHNVKFPKNINYCEDVLFWIQLLKNNDIKITYFNRAYYHYFMNENSITHKYTIDTYNNRLLYCKLLEQEYLPTLGYEKELRKVKLGIFFEAYMNNILSNKEAWLLLWNNKRAAFLEIKCLRWKVGYLFLLLGFFGISRKLLKFK